MKKALSAFVALFLVFGVLHAAHAATAEEIQSGSSKALKKLYKQKSVAQTLGAKAKGILVFPSIVKGGFVFGGSYGEGELLEGGKVVNYYNSASGSWGLQIGAQSYSYVVFLMTDKAVEYVRKTKGWEFGVGPTIVMVDDGVAKNLSTSTLKDDAYAFIFGQQGLMAGISLEGSKVTKIKR